MLNRGTTIIENRPSVVVYCQTSMWTPTMRIRALQRMDSKRKRPIWHTQPGMDEAGGSPQ